MVPVAYLICHTETLHKINTYFRLFLQIYHKNFNLQLLIFSHTIIYFCVEDIYFSIKNHVFSKIIQKILHLAYFMMHKQNCKNKLEFTLIKFCSK